LLERIIINFLYTIQRNSFELFYSRPSWGLMFGTSGYWLLVTSCFLTANGLKPCSTIKQHHNSNKTKSGYCYTCVVGDFGNRFHKRICLG